MSEEITYLSANQVITINAIQIRVYSPLEPIGVRDHSLLDSSIKRPQQSAFGEDSCPTIYHKAAALFESIAQNHVFMNANKRTALACLIMFLKMNHYRWTMDTQREQDFVVNVVKHQYDFDGIVNMIQPHCEKL